MEEMQKLLEKLKFSPSYLDGGKLLQIRCNKEKTNFEFVIEVNTITIKKYNGDELISEQIVANNIKKASVNKIVEIGTGKR